MSWRGIRREKVEVVIVAEAWVFLRLYALPSFFVLYYIAIVVCVELNQYEIRFVRFVKENKMKVKIKERIVFES